MSAMAPLPEDHPLMIAWTQYKSTDDYANTRRWALYDEHVDGSLWAAFMAGWDAAHPPPQSVPEADANRSAPRENADG